VYAEGLKYQQPGFDIAAMCPVNLNDDVRAALWPVKAMLSFYIGGMGAKSKNFHADLVRRMGYPEAADKVQELFLGGRRDEAIAMVPDEFADEISLCGPAQRIRDRLKVWKASRVTTLLAATRNPQALQLLAEELL